MRLPNAGRQTSFRHELNDLQWPNGARVSKKALALSNDTENIFANFPPSWETLAPSQHFACSQQNQPGAQVIIRMEPARGAESGGKEAGARL